MWWGRLVLAGTAVAAPVVAQAATEPETVIVNGVPTCAQATNDGGRSLSFACLNAALAQETSPSQAPDLKARDAARHGSPVELGTFSYTATQIRMGAAFGKSVKPERPAPLPVNNFLPHGRP